MDRWDKLFMQLESEHELLEQDARASTSQQVRDSEIRQISLVDRLRAHQGMRLRVVLESGEFLEGTLDEVQPEWIALTTAGSTYVVAGSGIVAFLGLTAKAQQSVRCDENPLGEGGGSRLTPIGAQALSRLKNKTKDSPERSFSQKIRECVFTGLRVIALTSSSRFEGSVVSVYSDHISLYSEIRNGSEREGTGVIPTQISIATSKIIAFCTPAGR